MISKDWDMSDHDMGPLYEALLASSLTEKPQNEAIPVAYSQSTEEEIKEILGEDDNSYNHELFQYCQPTEEEDLELAYQEMRCEWQKKKWAKLYGDGDYCLKK